MPADTGQLIRELTSLKTRLDRIEKGLSTSQLGNSSIEGGKSIEMYDREGFFRGRIGAHPDGSFGVTTTGNGTPPPKPGAPVVTPVLNGLRIAPNGTEDGSRLPADFSHYNVWLAVGEEIEDPEDLVSATNTGSVRDKILSDKSFTVITGLTYEEHRVWLTTVNTSGVETTRSAEVLATPLQAVSQDIIDGAIEAGHLAENAVTADALADGAVTTVALGDGVVDVTKLADGSVSGLKIAANTIAAGNIASDAIRSNHIKSGEITAGKLAVNAVQAGNIAAGAIQAGNIAAGAVQAGNIAAGVITAGALAAGSITGDKLQAGIIISDATLQSGIAGRRVVISGAGNDIRFFPVADETRYAQIYTYVPADLPDDIALEIRAIKSQVSAYRSKLYLNPNRAFLGVVDSTDESVNSGGAAELLPDAAFFGFKSATQTAGLNAYIDGSMKFDGKFAQGIASANQALLCQVTQYAESGAAQEVTITYPFTMNSVVAPLMMVTRDDHNTECKWWVWAATTTSCSVTWLDTADAHAIYFSGWRY